MNGLRPQIKKYIHWKLLEMIEENQKGMMTSFNRMKWRVEN